MSKQGNIILFSGNFNPITNAHLRIAQVASNAANAKHTIFIPAHDSYVIKDGTLIPGIARYKLIKDAISNDKMYVSDIEVNNFLPKRTYEIVYEIKKEYDKNFEFYNFCLVLGMYNIKTLTRWYNWESLVRENCFIACKRNGESLEETLKIAKLEKYANKFVEVEIPEDISNISSDLIHNLCKQKQFDKVRPLVPQNVYAYLRRFYDVFDRF